MTTEHDHRYRVRAASAGFRPWLSRYGLAIAGFAVVAGYFLWTEHNAHVPALFEWLPWLLLLLCPLMHVFMHRRHGRQSRDRNE